MATTTCADDAGRRARVLVVDPSEADARFVADTLEVATGLHAVTENDPEAALDRLDAESFDCVMAEQHLPEGDGISFLEEVGDNAPGTRRILHTTDDDSAVAERAWDRGIAYARKGNDVARYDVIADHIRGEVGEDTA